ncbi:MAG: lycopene cyclase domain-containing protein [Flavobacteriales bacterium]|nr:lycopene cyclase domain-containing protein [Flavobacteriales bacterium]
MNEHHYYLLINLFTISVPIIRSFEPRIAYYKSFRQLGVGIALTGGFFIIWDAIFTAREVWGFNPRYLSGIEAFGLPLGEWLFFVTVPFACVFIYRVLNYFFPRDPAGRWSAYLTQFLVSFSLALAITNFQREYTFWTFLLLGLTLGFLHYKGANHLGYFYRTYGVILIPFLIVNGILTGTGIEEQIVWYNDAENLGIRIGTIPVEDTFYGMLLILGVVTIYEYQIQKNESS